MRRPCAETKVIDIAAVVASWSASMLRTLVSYLWLGVWRVVDARKSALKLPRANFL